MGKKKREKDKQKIIKNYNIKGKEINVDSNNKTIKGGKTNKKKRKKD